MKLQSSFFALFLAVAVFAGNTSSCENSNPEAQRQTTLKQQNTESLMIKQPAPMVGFSMDRYILAQRLVRFNNPNKMSYLYMFFQNGSVLQISIVGKLTSTSKRLTDPQAYVTSKMPNVDTYRSDRIDVADEMGTWGSSEPAKVGLTTMGSLLEFGGFTGYVYSETPLNFKSGEKEVVVVQVEASDAERTQLTERLNDLRAEAAKSGIR